MSLLSPGCVLMQVWLLRQLFQSESEREQETRAQTKWQLQELRPPIPVRRSAPWCILTDVNAVEGLTSTFFNLPSSPSCCSVLDCSLTPRQNESFNLLHKAKVPQRSNISSWSVFPRSYHSSSRSSSRHRSHSRSSRYSWALRGNKTTKSGHCATHNSNYCYYLRPETKAPRGKVVFHLTTS